MNMHVANALLCRRITIGAQLRVSVCEDPKLVETMSRPCNPIMAATSANDVEGSLLVRLVCDHVGLRRLKHGFLLRCLESEPKTINFVQLRQALKVEFESFL